MSKLGYTFYPKDFISDPEVMMMSPEERGVYRDLIDLAYLNDNKITFSIEQLCRYTGANENLLKNVLKNKGKEHKNYYSIPSCDKRIEKATKSRSNGAKGGRPPVKPNPNPNPINNPDNNLDQTQTERQREIEIESKIEEEEERPNPQTPESMQNWLIENNHSWFEISVCKFNQISAAKGKTLILSYFQKCWDGGEAGFGESVRTYPPIKQTKLKRIKTDCNKFIGAWKDEIGKATTKTAQQKLNDKYGVTR